MDALGRLLRLLALLQRQPTWTSDALADRLAVTPRTVRRDVARLRDLGYMVDAEPGRNGGYRLVGGQALPPLALADDEAVAAAVALRDVAGSGVAGVNEAAVTALAKLEQVLPPRLRERVLALDAAIEHVAGGSRADVDPEILVALADACRQREQVRLAYTDGRGRDSRRDAEPYRLVHTRGRWYVVAFDRLRQEWRTFRVDRVSDVQPLGVRSEPRELPDATSLVAHAVSAAPYRWHAEIRLDTSAGHAAARIPPTVGTVSPDGQGTLLRIGADDLDWLARYLVGLNIGFEVLVPTELRGALAALGERLAADFADR